MDAYQRELSDMRRELLSMGRKELQALAKSYGVKANIKSSEIVDELLRVSTSGEQMYGAATNIERVEVCNSPARSGDQADSDAGKQSVSQQIASFGKAIIGLVTGSPVRDSKASSATSSAASQANPDASQRSTRDQALAAQTSLNSAATSAPLTTARALNFTGGVPTSTSQAAASYQQPHADLRRVYSQEGTEQAARPAATAAGLCSSAVKGASGRASSAEANARLAALVADNMQQLSLTTQRAAVAGSPARRISSAPGKTDTTTGTTAVSHTTTSKQPTSRWGQPANPGLPSSLSPRRQGMPLRMAPIPTSAPKQSSSTAAIRTFATEHGPLTAAAGAQAGLLARQASAGVHQHQSSTTYSSSAAAGVQGVHLHALSTATSGGLGSGRPATVQPATSDGSQWTVEHGNTAMCSSTCQQQNTQMPSRGQAGNKAAAAAGQASHADPPLDVAEQEPSTPGRNKALLHTPSRVLPKQQQHARGTQAHSPRKGPHLSQAPQFNSTATETAQANAAQGMLARTGRLSTSGFATPPRWRPSNADAAAATPAQFKGSRTPTEALLSPRLTGMGSARRVDALGCLAGMSKKQPAGGSRTPEKELPTKIAAAPAPACTPLSKHPRRLVPAAAGADVSSSKEQEDKELKQLQQVAQRAIITPDRGIRALHGPEQAKQWLQKRLVAPLQQNSGSALSCSYGLLLYGAQGCGKTALVHCLASELKAGLYYLSAQELKSSFEQRGHKLMRALFQVAHQTAPSIICLDDAHLAFPLQRHADPDHLSHRMRTELLVQLEQLAALQEEQQLQQMQEASRSTAGVAVAAAGCAASGDARQKGDQRQRGSQRTGGSKPAWGSSNSGAAAVTKGRGPVQPISPVRPASSSTASSQAKAQQAQPVIVVIATHSPESLDPVLVQALAPHLHLEPPATASREALLLGWLLPREAALGVADLELLARSTEKFSCSDLLRLCKAAADVARAQRGSSSITRLDFEAALRNFKPSISRQRLHQLAEWDPAK